MLHKKQQNSRYHILQYVACSNQDEQHFCGQKGKGKKCHRLFRLKEGGKTTDTLPLRYGNCL